jgi:hypothetical protein
MPAQDLISELERRPATCRNADAVLAWFTIRFEEGPPVTRHWKGFRRPVEMDVNGQIRHAGYRLPSGEGSKSHAGEQT